MDLSRFSKTQLKNISMKEFNNSETINMHIFSGCEIDFSEFFEFHLENVLFYRCVIEENDLSQLKAKSVRVVESRVIGNNFVGSTLEDVSFETSLIMANSFAKSSMTNVRFADCNIGMNGLSGLSYENVTGLRLQKKVDSKNNSLVFDLDGGYVFHTLVSGSMDRVRNFLEEDQKYIASDYRKELYDLVNEVYLRTLSEV